jgi:hypothetical protein
MSELNVLTARRLAKITCKIISFIPSYEYLTIGRSTLENTCPADDKPNGSAQNIKYLTVFLNFQENPKYF